ncbi:MAG TPA: methyltransferase, partial [Steroidobacteraceae bacterium]|nr:methyltransferase [Steroidobacteraceae bacterium]
EVLVFEAGRYAHSDFSRLLRRDHPRSLHPVVYCGLNLIANAGALPQALKTRQVAQQVAHGTGYFEQLGNDPELAETFARFMTLTTTRAEQFILENHRFEPFRLAVDVGGSHGSLLLSLLAARPQAHGILFDLPEVVAQAPTAIASHAAGARVKLVGGSFFDSVPAGGDLYLLKQILHDWDDERSLSILRRIRAAIAPDGRLAVLDRLLPEAPRPHPAYHMDLYMMLLVGAQERKLSQFETLFGASGFRLDRVTEYPDGPSVMEALPV